LVPFSGDRQNKSVATFSMIITKLLSCCTDTIYRPKIQQKVCLQRGTLYHRLIHIDLREQRKITLRGRLTTWVDANSKHDVKMRCLHHLPSLQFPHSVIDSNPLLASPSNAICTDGLTVRYTLTQKLRTSKF
jgi:hypothetical protein